MHLGEGGGEGGGGGGGGGQGRQFWALVSLGINSGSESQFWAWEANFGLGSQFRAWGGGGGGQFWALGASVGLWEPIFGLILGANFGLWEASFGLWALEATLGFGSHF